MTRSPNATVVAVILLAAGCTGSPAPSAPAPPSTPQLVAPPTLTDTRTVQGVEDGRTVLLSDGVRLRIAGLAAPEECWAGAATAFAKAFLLDKAVRVDAIVDDEAPLRLADGTEYALFAVNQGVMRGDSPDDKAFRDAEAAATKAGLGLWGEPCKGQATRPTTTTQPPPVTKAPTVAPAVFGCAVHYDVNERWHGGSNTNVTITNTGTAPISGWTLRWSFSHGEIVTHMWDTTVQQNGVQVTAVNVAKSATIPAGGAQLVGFTASHDQEHVNPTAFSLNDHPCAIR